MLLSIRADERAALVFEDLASALDAGLPLQSIGGDPAAGERTLHGILTRRQVRLSTTEDAVLLHSWRAGKAPAALRARAQARQRRADFARMLWAGLRYPLLLAGMLLVASVATMAFVGPWVLATLLILYVTLAAAGLWLRRAVRAGAAAATKVPGLGPLLHGLAELPYLETLGALYGAGVALREAHHAAVASTPPGPVRERLAIADAMLQGGQPLHEALARSLALHPETRSLLSTGEQAGDLESALERALVRRRDVTGRGITTLTRVAGQVAYVLAVVGVVYIVFSFYSSLYGGFARSKF